MLKIDKFINKVEQLILILSSCDYRCNLSSCSKKFYLLSQNRDVPFFVFKPILIKKDIRLLPGFFICSYSEYELSGLQKRVLELIKASKTYVCSSRYLPPSYPIYRIIKAQMKIVENPKRTCYLSDICEELEVSPSWLSKGFKDKSGISICQLLVKMKCCYALWELISSDKLEKSVALYIGYIPLYYSQLFRFHFGVGLCFVRRQLVPKIAQLT